jgi:TonB family protein
MIYRRILISLIVLPLLLSAAFASKKDAEATALIEHAKQLSDIRAEGAPAFRMRVSFKIFKQDGSVAEGTYFEAWTSKAQWRKEVAFGDFRRTEVAVGRRSWLLESTAATPEEIESVSGFTEPLTLQPEARQPRRVEDRESDGLIVRCVETGKEAALCFDKVAGTLTSKGELDHRGGLTVRKACVYSSYQKFGDHLVAKSYECYQDKKTTLEAKIIEFTVEPALDPSLFTALEGARESVNCLESVQLPVLTYGDPPPPPRRSPRDVTVVLSVVVGTDGKPRGLRVVPPQIQEFDRAALDAVKHWRFKPALCGREPIEKTISLEIEFHIY